ncbi:MAG: hypothetical protein Q8O27_00760 [Enterobacteriaceae bacterium]|nr:hypothetical protein [Enterobacteriaceae bacterium]
MIETFIFGIFSALIGFGFGQLSGKKIFKQEILEKLPEEFNEENYNYNDGYNDCLKETKEIIEKL